MKTGGQIPPEARTPAPIETDISIDPIVLRDFGIYTAVDASMPVRPSDEYQILLHPSFLKDYAGEENGNAVFIKMWRMAAEALRSANRVVIIGYSLPPADSAAWTLLLTNCDAARTTVVNPDPSVMSRYRRLLVQHLPTASEWIPPQHFVDWVAAQRPTASGHEARSLCVPHLFALCFRRVLRLTFSSSKCLLRASVSASPSGAITRILPMCENTSSGCHGP